MAGGGMLRRMMPSRAAREGRSTQDESSQGSQGSEVEAARWEHNLPAPADGPAMQQLPQLQQEEGEGEITAAQPPQQQLEQAEAAVAETHAPQHNQHPPQQQQQQQRRSSLNSGRQTPTADLLPSHPITPNSPGGASPGTTFATPAAAPVSGPASSPGSQRGGEFQTQIRKVTANLVDILDQMSAGNGGDSSGSSTAGSSKGGVPPRRSTIGARGDSVATIVDLESQGSLRPGEKCGEPEEVVPVQQVRRLTTTLVDILRHMAVTPMRQHSRDPEHGGSMNENAGLLADTASELSLDDKLSLSSSAAAGSTRSADSAKDSEISAATALLQAQYLPQQEYRGDDVRPFFVERGLPHQSPAEGDALKPETVELDGKDADSDAVCALPAKLKKNVRINWVGLFVFTFYILSFIMYVGLRAAKTLGLGSNLWYGIVVLAVEILGGLAMLPYGLCLCARVQNGAPAVPAAQAQAGSKVQAATTALGYHVRVLIPCYKEPLDVVAKTFMAAMYAAMPANCRRTVYLLDDGRDDDKRRFVRGLGLPNAVYVSGRKRAKGEMNGKSANINNAAKQIYPPGCAIPLDEIMCVFDADQVPNADFFFKTMPLLDGGQDVGMVLSPQTFYNINPDGDIFNHANVHFWDYTQPGYDALGLISCTGTNFLVRARAFQHARWFPEWTLTEDFALGIELKRRNWQCRYVDEYLAVGEAPDEVRNCFQQRSRWAKGHFQVFFQRGRNPVAGAGAKGLSLLMRWMYGSVVLSYFSAFLGTPLLMLVPIITVWFGAFPIVINFYAAVSITIYYGATLLLQYYTRSLGHLKSMWFASVSNCILWWAFLKALNRATLGRWLKGSLVFKVTAKGLQRLNALPLRDLWMSTLWFVFSLVTLIFGLVHFFKGGVMDTPLAISLIFMVYNLVPQYLLLQYAAYRSRGFFNVVCRLAMLLSTGAAILGVVLVWVLYPQSYNYKSALGSSLYFFDTQRVGSLPPDFRVDWRKSAFVQESAATVYLATNPNATFSLDGDFSSGSDFLVDGFDPFSPLSGGSPFGRRRLAQASDPFAAAVQAAGVPVPPTDAFAAASADPFAVQDTAGGDPFAPPPAPTKPPSGGSTTKAPPDPFAATNPGPFDPFAPGSGPLSPPVPSVDPFDPFASTGPGLGGNFQERTVATDAPWDLSGGWMSGMEGGNIKSTSPIAFSTALLAWGYMAFPGGFQAAGQEAQLRESVRWGADYLSKVHRLDPVKNSSLLVTRVGDIDTELLLWYRPEDGGVRDAFAVDLAAAPEGAGADLGGSVAAGLAAAAALFQSSGTADSGEYAAGLLAKAQEVYAAAKLAKGRFSGADYNMTLLYNSSTVYDDLAWAAGWLYKATKEEAYLGDVYDFYVKHLQTEAEAVDWKFAFDWDNVFWPLNVLLAQETGKGTFKKQSEQFLRSWMCANNAVNYTQRGRAFNPMTSSLGATSNAALLALMYADVVAATEPAAAQTYKCWGLSQMRYVLGDAGRSLVVGVGPTPPKRTQDRGAGCPAPPAVCNRVTGLLSPDPDSHKLTGALMYGPGLSDNFLDVRSNDAARVGIENNAGFTGALAGAALLPDGMWEVCLQQFGIYRSNPVCGAFVSV